MFELRSSLDRDALETFLLDEYEPAPVVSPWNGSSGFHPKDRKDAIIRLERSIERRFSAYRETIASARMALARYGIVDKPSSEQKLSLIRELRRTLPDAALDWLDTAIVVIGNNTAYPPLLGSGGNDGHYEFSNNYARAVVQCLGPEGRDDSAKWLAAALWGEPSELQPKLSLAHLSRDASPTNSPRGEADSLGNPWDLVLGVQGTLVLAAGAARRHGGTTGGALVAPFAARSTAAGYGSAVEGETGREELWLPLWSGWATHGEIAALARESRAQVASGRDRRQATSGLDFARAAGELGVARGIEGFERYAILERAGQATLAVPAGRITVAPRPGAAALRLIDRWLVTLVRYAGSDRCPRAPRASIHELQRAVFRLATRGERQDACRVLEAMGAVEHLLARTAAQTRESGVRPLVGATAAPWIETANDGSPEFAVAASVASLRDRIPRSPAVRDYLHGTRNGGRDFDEERRHAVEANGPVPLLAAVHVRRHTDAARNLSNGGPLDHRRLAFDIGSWCDLGVVRLFAAGVLDNARILRLLRGLAVLDHRNPSVITNGGREAGVAQPTLELLALAWTGPTESAREGREELGPRPGWAARLAAGAIAPVVRDAVLRLRLAGLGPIPRADDLLAGAPPGRRLAAALLVPLGPTDIRAVTRRLTVAGAVDDDQMEEHQ